MKKHNGKGMMTLGLLLILAAAALSARNIYEDRQAAQYADEFLQSYVESVEEASEDAPAATQKPEKASEAEPATDDLAPEEVLSEAAETVSVQNVYGVLSIPALELVLPVQDNWSYPKLRQTPCRYFGSAEERNLVICAHNYSAHFGKLRELRLGDTITFSDEAGTLHTYTVAAAETLQPTAVEELTESAWDLSLVTCTKGGKTRFVLRCEEAE